MRAKLKDVYLGIIFQPVFMPHFLKTTGLTLKRLLAFNNIVFPHFKNVRKAKSYPDEQMSLIIMDTFKAQDSDEVAKLVKTIVPLLLFRII